MPLLPTTERTFATEKANYPTNLWKVLGNFLFICFEMKTLPNSMSERPRSKGRRKTDSSV